tara:strand:- start:149 stop:529 length:381 start_codon:yes stop_codon:yes gene_type:complete
MSSEISYLKTLLAGSNLFVTTPFLLLVNKIGPKKTYSYYNYSLILPIWLGFWNVFFLIISKLLGLSTRTRFLLQGLFTFILSVMLSKILKAYKFTNEEWNMYYIMLFLLHMFTWNFTVYHIETLLQ